MLDTYSVQFKADIEMLNNAAPLIMVATEYELQLNRDGTSTTIVLI
jgi:hypothetical protein